MATTEITQITPTGTSERLRNLAAASYSRVVAAWRAMRNRRSVAKLLEWDEHMLRDIGITQGDVRSALSSPLAEDPSYRLGVMSVERRAAFRASAAERLQRKMDEERKAIVIAGRVRSKSETTAGIHRYARRVMPRPVLEL